MRASHPVIFLAMALVGQVATVGAMGQDQGPGVMDASALATRLARLADRIKGSASYRVRVDESWSTEGTFTSERGSTRYELDVERPGKFAIRVRPEGEPRP